MWSGEGGCGLFEKEREKKIEKRVWIAKILQKGKEKCQARGGTFCQKKIPR
jgi:hypothetical protein